MEENKENKEKELEQLSVEDIIKEGENIYPISEESDRKSFDINRIKNWSEIFYNIKQEKTRKRFNELMSKSEHANFFEALSYEYGINGKPQDLKKALSIYKESADNSVDAISMYKMYHIYKNEYNKFGLIKRNRVFEKYYLYKSFAYLTYQELKRNTYLCNRFDVVLEIVIQFDQEDQNFDKLKRFLLYLKKYYKELSIRQRDILVIESVFNFKFGNEIQNMKNAIQQLINLIPSDKANDVKEPLELEIYYKIACYLLEVNELNTAEYYFNYLINSKYYRAYPDFALFLEEKKCEPQKALVILRIAFENGFNSANILYYNIFLNSFNFSKINDDNATIKNFMKILLTLLCNNCVIENIYSFFEYFYFRKILKKNNYKELLNEFKDYTREFAQFIIKMTNSELKKENTNNDYLQNDNNKEIILEYFQRNEYYAELNLVCGILLYYGIEDVVEKDYINSLEKFKISYKSSYSQAYKRFCYSYIYKIRNKLNSKGIINPKNNKLLVSNYKLNKTKNKIYQMYKSSLEKDNFLKLSASFFYYLSRLLNKKIGNSGDDLLEYICLERALECNDDNPIFGSIICYYRKQKTINLLNNEKYDKIMEGICGIKDSEGYGDDNSLCPICFDQKRNILCLPCKHLFCNNCMEKILSKRKCPICRGSIIFTYNTKKENKKEEK
jgi:hypothetical protein